MSTIINYEFGNSNPRIVRIVTNALLATVTTAGWLNSAVNEGLTILPTDKILIAYGQGTATSGNLFFDVSISSGVITLSVAESDVAIPTIANHIAVFTNTSGALGEDAATAINGGNIQAGLSGTAGTLSSFPATASKGSFILAAVANTGNTNVTVSNVAHGQDTVYSIGDIGSSTGGVVVATANLRMKSVAAASAAGGAAAQSFTDAFCTSGSVVTGNWVTQTNAASVLKIVPSNGSFVVTSSADAGSGTFSYTITK